MKVSSKVLRTSELQIKKEYIYSDRRKSDATDFSRKYLCYMTIDNT